MSWNHTVPKIMTSLDHDKKDNFKDINYETSLVFSVVLILFFGGAGLNIPFALTDNFVSMFGDQPNSDSAKKERPSRKAKAAEDYTIDTPFY